MACPEICELGDRIVSLTISQAVELRDYLKDKYGIEPASAGVVMQQQAPQQQEQEPEKTEYDVILEGFEDNKKLDVIKTMRKIIDGLALKEAKDFVESAPRAVKEGISKEEAEQLKSLLTEVGGKISIK